MNPTTIALLIAGLVFLAAGAELLVRGAARLAAAAGISPLVIGLTVVAYGTSTPELAVSLQAGLAGKADIAVANVVGSNIFNVLCTLGLCSVLLPLAVAQQLVRLDVPIMIGASVLVLALALDGRLGPADGAMLAAGLGLYTVWAIRKSRGETAGVRAEYEHAFGERSGGGGAAVHLLLVAGGLALLVLGSRWFVHGAGAVARALGLSEVVIGLTIVAAGTSLPEVATSIVATLRKEPDLAIGNIVGSNVYNLLAILGLSSLVTPGGLAVAPSIINFDMLFMVGVAVACLPIFFTGSCIARWEGALFLGCYVAYAAYLILNATQHDALPLFSTVMLEFVAPLIAVTLAVLGVRAVRAGRRARQ